MSKTILLKGQLLDFTGDPFAQPHEEVTLIETRGAVAIRGGEILDRGPADRLSAAYPDAQVEDHGDGLILPGFVDSHVHYPQTAMIASWGKRLIDWLNTYTFPEESRFADPDYAATIAARYLDLTTAHGTTSMVSFCTIHSASVEAFFAEAAKRGQRVIGGRTCMDRNAPDSLRDTAQTAYDESKALLEKWHGQGRISYAITPRFTPTSTPDQLAALGALWGEYPQVLMQTHLSEQTDEIHWVKDLHPESRDYLDTYEAHGLLGENGLYGHAIHLERREIDRLKDVNAALVHCPTSNAFIGSGLFDMQGLKGEGLRVGLATDTGGGSDFSMLRTMAAAYEVAQLRRVALHPAQLLWLATAGSAGAVGMADRIGTLAPGSEADIIVLDLASTEAIAQRSRRANDLWEALFPTIMMGDDRALRAVWIGGRKALG